MNPNDETQRGRLFRAIEGSYRGLEPFRNMNQNLVRDYAGPAYGAKPGDEREKYLNLMNQAVVGYSMALAANRPQVLLSTRHPELRAFAKHFQLAVNNMLSEIRVERTIRRWIRDAIFCVGVVKVHLADSGLVQVEDNVWMDPGTPYASNVGLDNWIYDLGAKDWGEVKYTGDMYRIPFDDLKGDLYDQDAVRDLVPTSKNHCDEDRLERISKGYETDADEFEPMIDLADIYVRRDGKIYTFPVKDRSQFQLHGKPVAVMDVYGADFQPYHILGFDEVSENIMPTSIASHLASLERLVNNLMRKQARQAKRQKDVHVYTAAGAEGASRVQRAGDGEWVQVNDVSELGVVKQGGVDPGNQAFMLQTMEMFDRMAGNLTAMLGLGQQAATLGQEELIHGASSRKEQYMQQQVMEATRGLVRDMGLMLWEDKFKVLVGQIPVEGAEGYEVDATWMPDDREGNFLDYNFDIDIHSMSHQSPSQRVQAINGLMTQIYAPLMPMLEQQGGIIDMHKLTDIYAELMNLPRLKEVIVFQGMRPDDSPGPQVHSGKPASTTRNYVRRNVPTGGTQASRSHVQQQAWLNNSVNQDQSASLAKPAAQ